MFYGYEFADITAESFIKVSGRLQYQFYKKNYVDVHFNYAYISDSVLDLLINSSISESVLSGYSIGLSSDTVIGPVDLRYVCSPDHNGTDSFYFSIGHWF